MKHALYEDPVTHQYAWIRLPHGFLEGDKYPLLPTGPWFSTREEAVAALRELFNQDDLMTKTDPLRLIAQTDVAPEGSNPTAMALGPLRGLIGDTAGAENLTPEQRRKAAMKAANARWAASQSKG
jgi:hypothetical protein